jgi:D-alanine-D-alanine ligase
MGTGDVTMTGADGGRAGEGDGGAGGDGGGRSRGGEGDGGDGLDGDGDRLGGDGLCGDGGDRLGDGGGRDVLGGGDGRDGRIHLVVLFGGQSAEHDVSCTSATHVLRAADPAKYRITPVGIGRDGSWALATGAQRALAAGVTALPDHLDTTGEAVLPADVLGAGPTDGARTVVLPILHGPMGEDGTVQGLMELSNVAYVGSGVLGSALGMDKAMAKQVLAQAGIPQASHVALRDDDVSPGTPARLVEQLGLPLFVKPANMGSSIGVSKAKTVEAVRYAIELALSYDEWVLVEEAVDGREIEVAVLGGRPPRASVPGEIVPGAEFYDYADKYLDDGSQALVPAPLSTGQSDEVRALATRVFEVLRAEGLARVDFFFEEGGRGFLCNEINTMPGFTPISMYPKLWQASGLSYPDLIDELVRLALERHSHRRRRTDH